MKLYKITIQQQLAPTYVVAENPDKATKIIKDAFSDWQFFAPTFLNIEILAEHGQYVDLARLFLSKEEK